MVKSSSTLSRAVNYFLELYGPGQAETLIREKAAALIETSRAKGLFDSPPIPIELVAEELGISILKSESLPCSGRLLPARGGFTLQLASSEPLVRQRFTIGHEIGHTFFSPSLEKHRKKGAVPVLLGYSDDRLVEKLCDVVSSELLLPTKDLSPYIESISPSFDAFREIMQTFQVSMRALAIRLSSLSARWAFVMCEYTTRPGSNKKKLRVKWSSTPKGFFVPTHDAFNEESEIARSFRTRRRWQGWDLLDLGSFRDIYFVESILLIKEKQFIIIDTESRRKEAPSDHTSFALS